MSNPYSDQLNALVAEKIMGWKRLEDEAAFAWHMSRHTSQGHKKQIWVLGDSIMACTECGSMPRFFGDIAEAWKVVEKMWALGWKFELERPFYEEGRWRASFTDKCGALYQEVVADAPTAICLAALATTKTVSE